MKLGVLSVLFSNKPLKEVLEYLKGLGVETVELGCGGYPGNAHCKPEVLLKDEGAFAEFKKTIDESGLISALSCHGNMVHPDRKSLIRLYRP